MRRYGFGSHGGCPALRFFVPIPSGLQNDRGVWIPISIGMVRWTGRVCHVSFTSEGFPARKDIGCLDTDPVSQYGTCFHRYGFDSYHRDCFASLAKTMGQSASSRKGWSKKGRLDFVSSTEWYRVSKRPHLFCSARLNSKWPAAAPPKTTAIPAVAKTM